jgi:hypothetical protein
MEKLTAWIFALRNRKSLHICVLRSVLGLCDQARISGFACFQRFQMPITGNLSTLAFSIQQEKFPHITFSRATGNSSTYPPPPL